MLTVDERTPAKAGCSLGWSDAPGNYNPVVVTRGDAAGRLRHYRKYPEKFRLLRLRNGVYYVGLKADTTATCVIYTRTPGEHHAAT